MKIDPETEISKIIDENGKVRNKSKKALTGKGGGDNITKHAAESCEPDL